MWILGISAIIGNAFVLLQRLRPNKSGRSNNIRVQGIMIGHLALADSLMGVYMLIIASADVYYRDRYAFFAENWQTSLLCKIAGFLSVISSESSVFFMMVISLDRFINIVFPFQRFLILRPKSAQIYACTIWFITFTISIIPVLARGYFGNAFYGRSTVCLALPLTTDRPQGWQYSSTVFVGFNLTAFIIMTACYVSIYFKAKTSSLRAGRGSEAQSNQIQLALRMSFLVFSDMCCWMPIIVMGILSLTRAVEIPATSYAWTAVFVLPLNSSLNPYLYTILTRKLNQRQRNKSMMSSSSLSVINQTKECNCAKESNGIMNPASNGDIDTGVIERAHTMVANNILIENMGYPTIKKLAINGGITKGNMRLIEYDLQMAVQFLHQEMLLSRNCVQEDCIFVKKISSELIHAYLIVPSMLDEFVINGKSKEEAIEANDESKHMLELSMTKLDKILQLISDLATE
ncbi:G-protein coupled receptor GRL101-like [Amphiura filiformis]|uniref:G-protein coupled receptor GRL101-like n=1 Tax=Amphiura filiformis TaxID=82378 RepID=UPI003B2127F8